MILIADGGSTKTAWVASDGKTRRGFTTRGINPYHTTLDGMVDILTEELIPAAGTDVSEIWFYGAGCTTARIPEMRTVFAGLFPSARIEVFGDMLGACRGLCAAEPGVVCILGTGSNSCLYDGTRIIANTPPLGYILGDEGSGAALGRAFVSDCLKGQLPAGLKNELLAEFSLTEAEIIERVYRRPMANRFLAGFAPFICARRHLPPVRSLVVREFGDFLRRNVLQYGSREIPLYFTGSVAWYFSDLLREAVTAAGLLCEAIVPSPIEGLAAYHLDHE